ncbi:MAG: GNAT family N-acetyltransferase [Gemmobacter sp.]
MGRACKGAAFSFARLLWHISAMVQPFTLRRATPDDLSAVDVLLECSYPRLLKADYPPSVLVTALPLIVRAQPVLLASGRYFVAVDGADGHLLGAGGYSLASPVPRGQAQGPREEQLGHIRHVVTDPDRLRRGVGRAVMTCVLTAAAAEGVTVFDCLSTRTAVPFYAALGFRTLGAATVPLAPGIEFPAIRMRRP